MPPKLYLWTDQLEEILITEVEKRSILRDITSTDYRKTHLKDPHYENIAKLLGSKFTGTMAASRFASMTQTFQTNIRKIKESKKSGKGADEIFVPKWKCFEKQQFLNKTCTATQSSSNLNFEGEIEKDEELGGNSTAAEPCPNMYFDDNIQEWRLLPPDESLPSHDTEGTASSTTNLNMSCPVIIESPPPTISSSCSSHTSAAASTASQAKVFTPEQHELYVKRGSAKKKKTALKEAVICVRELTRSIDLPQEDSADIFAAYIASKLKGMPEDE